MKDLVKNRIHVCMIAALVLMLIGSPVAQAAEKIQLVHTGSAPGALFYYMVNALAPLLNEKLGHELNMTPMASGGSTANIWNVAKGEADFGLSINAHLYLGWRGEGPFKKRGAAKVLRILAKPYDSGVYFATLKKSGITRMEQLAGKKVSLGPPGSGALFNSKNILTTLGIKVKEQYLQFGDAGKALLDERIVAFGQTGAPAAAVTQAAETKPAHLVSFNDEEMKKLVDAYPWFSDRVMRGGIYKGVGEVRCPHISVFWYAHERVPQKIVYDILKVVYQKENLKRLGDGYPLWKTLVPGLEPASKLGPPLHPGAVQYYKEIGLKIPESLIQ